MDAVLRFTGAKSSFGRAVGQNLFWFSLAMIALAIWLTQLGLSPVLAHVASALFGAVISGVLAVMGLSYLKAENLKPKVTLQQVRRDVTTAKELAR